MNVQEAERRYADLEKRYDMGTLSGAQFDKQREQLMVVDGKGGNWKEGQAVELWDPRTGEPLQTLAGYSRQVLLVITHIFLWSECIVQKKTARTQAFPPIAMLHSTPTFIRLPERLTEFLFPTRIARNYQLFSSCG